MRRSLLPTTALALVLALGAVPAGATPAAAAAREVLPADAKPVAYDIAVAPDVATLSFTGRAVLTFDVVAPTSKIVVNGIDLAVASAILDGKPAAAQVDPARQQITFNSAAPLRVGRHSLTVDYAGKINESAIGLFVSEFPAQDGAKGKILSTQFEPGDARRVAPMWDEPALKAVFTLEVTAPKGWQAVSNMPPAKSEALADGRTRIRFQPSPKMSSYLAHLTIGALDRITAKAGATEVGVVTRAGYGEQGRTALNDVVAQLAYYNDYFATPYPLPKLDNIAVPGVGGFGAMENWGAILYFEPFLLIDPKISSAEDRQNVFVFTSHEVSHQWFGDLVTMSWWDDLWLNEGFASWMENKSTDKLHPEWKIWLQASEGRETALRLDARSTTHPVVQTINTIEEANLAFDVITYQKGQEVIRMIEDYVGEAPFQAGVRAYMKKHAYDNTVSLDLWRELSAASKTPIEAIARDFTTQPGIPLIEVKSTACEAGKGVVILSQGRFGVDAASKTAQTWTVPVKAAVPGGTMVRTLVSGPQAKRLTFDACGPVKINYGHSSYFRTLYDPASFAGLRGGFGKLAEGDQLGLLDDAFALGEAGYQPFSDYFSLTAEVGAEADPIILAQVVRNLRRGVGLYRGLPGEPAFKTFAGGRLRGLFAAVGWAPKVGESENVSLLRASLIAGLAEADDAEVIKAARDRFAAHEAGTATLSNELYKPVLGVVAAKADAGAFAGLRRMAKAAKSPREQQLLLEALASVEDETLAREALALALTEETPKQLAPTLVRIVAAGHPDLVWTWARAHEAELEARLDSLQRLEFWPALVAASNDPKVGEELAAYAAAKLPAAARKPVEERRSALAYRAQVRAQRLGAVDAWLAAKP